MASETKSIAKGRRGAKDLHVETYSKDFPGEKRLFKNSHLEAIKIDKKDEKSEIVSFISGNPFVESTRGILHLYKEK